MFYIKKKNLWIAFICLEWHHSVYLPADKFMDLFYFYGIWLCWQKKTNNNPNNQKQEYEVNTRKIHMGCLGCIDRALRYIVFFSPFCLSLFLLCYLCISKKYYGISLDFYLSYFTKFLGISKIFMSLWKTGFSNFNHMRFNLHIAWNFIVKLSISKLKSKYNNKALV